jgi:hypothetical protein
MNQTNHFFNLGYGWLCKHCSAADSEAKNQPPEIRAGFFSHADLEKKEGESRALALASWTNSSRLALTCPRCGIEETISNA